MTRPLVLLLACLALCVAASAAPRDQSHAKSQARRGSVASPSQTAPDTTGTIKPPVNTVSPPPAAHADDEVLPPPVTLPTASRARMRTCGERWQAKKMAGTTGDEIWREFAMKCLAAQD